MRTILAQRGFAVITAILVVALAASVVAYMSWQEQLWTRQVENVRSAAQAQAIVRPAIDFARAVVAEDARNSTVDDGGEFWARSLAGVAVDGGELSGFLSDAQGRFNLNNLVRDGKRSDADVAALRRLLQVLGLPPDLAQAAVDWIDADSEVSLPGGAEDQDYLAMDPPYRAANRLLVDVSELHAVKGFRDEWVARLAPFVTALPKPTAVNVNTAPAEVLVAVVPGLQLAQARALAGGRKSNPFKDKADFRKRLPAETGELSDGAFDVATAYFVVTGEVRIDRVRTRFAALLERGGGAWPRVLWRKYL